MRDDDLVPWAVDPEHRQRYQIAVLRAEARHRAGMSLDEDRSRRLRSWRLMLEKPSPRAAAMTRAHGQLGPLLVRAVRSDCDHAERTVKTARAAPAR
ncbi:hypothetical protein B7767_11085 [Streptomyces sp. 13-12-16]|uniref:hypothetical protein n=1 Tax=Streptomyces sp. 13-12-16 TaxID=1570823 RepID=UPI000A1F2036|nr:hypothetical protein [Streptomyces sp. 13-12-16]OSP43270.1 hypothetical protein B7767_11085 [Streptomyces sp. 13-12-16]